MSNLILPNQEKKLVQAVPNGTQHVAPPTVGVGRSGDHVLVVAAFAGQALPITLTPSDWRKFRAIGDAVADAIEPEAVELPEGEITETETTKSNKIDGI